MGRVWRAWTLLLMGWSRHCHELTHVLVALPVADQASYDFADGAARLAWPADAPTWWIRLAHLAPTLAGFALAAVAYAHAGDVAMAVEWVASGLAAALDAPAAADEIGSTIEVFVAINWGAYVLPSRSDLFPFAAA